MNKPLRPEHQLSFFDLEDPFVSGPVTKTQPQGKYSNLVVYVDESGDHGMVTMDPKYPVFVLAFCVFNKRHYCEKVVPALQYFKFGHFGHDSVVLHESEIRKERGAFGFFKDRQQKTEFMAELGGIIERSNFILISSVIAKEQLRARGGALPNPYNVALAACLQSLYAVVCEKKQEHLLTHVIVECRGRKEDDELELEFRRICDGANQLGIQLPFDVIFADKKINSAGLQLADLVARPVGMSVLRPEQANKTFDVLKTKFFCKGGREDVGQGYLDFGLMIYPEPESEKPR